MLELKRTQAEREARSRGGLTSNVVNERLDYLVVGSIPSAGWKHGNYGTKIEKAKSLYRENRRPEIIPESDFMAALALCLPTGSGELDSKIVVCTYKFAADLASLSLDCLQGSADELANALDCYVATHLDYRSLYSEQSDLYDLDKDIEGIGCYLKFRIVKEIPADLSGQEFVDIVARGFERIPGVDGTLSWFERIEGSASYIRLLRETSNANQIPLLDLQ
jgi:hypothetical protein